jgi:hypothetical protein
MKCIVLAQLGAARLHKVFFVSSHQVQKLALGVSSLTRNA